MEVLLEADSAPAGKDRLHRAPDRIVALKGPLEQHLARRGVHRFNAQFDILLYDLTSTYFEGSAEGVPQAARGYSRDHRSDCPQIVPAWSVDRAKEEPAMRRRLWRGLAEDLKGLQRSAATWRTAGTRSTTLGSGMPFGSSVSARATGRSLAIRRRVGTAW